MNQWTWKDNNKNNSNEIKEEEEKGTSVSYGAISSGSMYT